MVWEPCYLRLRAAHGAVLRVFEVQRSELLMVQCSEILTMQCSWSHVVQCPWLLTVLMMTLGIVLGRLMVQCSGYSQYGAWAVHGTVMQNSGYLGFGAQ